MYYEIYRSFGDLNKSLQMKTILETDIHFSYIWISKLSNFHRCISRKYENVFLPVQGYMNGKIWYIFNTIWIEEVQG